MTLLRRSEALAQGLIIDNCCQPPVAYRGSRFNPTEIHEVLTEREEAVVLAAVHCIRRAGGGASIIALERIITKSYPEALTWLT